MGDIITNAHGPYWRQCYQAALLELDPTKLLKRIADARSAILDQIEDGFSKPSNAEQVALRHALEMLGRLRTITESEFGEQRKTGT